MLLLFPSEKYSLLRVLGAAATESSKIQQHVLRCIFVRSFGNVDRPKILEVTVGYITLLDKSAAGMHVCTLLRSSNVTTLTDATVLADAAEAHTRALQRNQQIARES